MQVLITTQSPEAKEKETNRQAMSKAIKTKFLKKMPIVWETKGQRDRYRQQLNQGQEEIQATIKPSKEINEMKEVDPTLTAKSFLSPSRVGDWSCFKMTILVCVNKLLWQSMLPPITVRPSTRYQHIDFA